MKIDPSVSKNTADIGTVKDSSTRSQGTAASTTSTAQTPARQSSQGSSGEVSLSPLASTLRSGGTDVGDIDTQTVQQIKDAISKNQLPIDTSKIAAGLLDSVRSFLKTS